MKTTIGYKIVVPDEVIKSINNPPHRNNNYNEGEICDYYINNPKSTLQQIADKFQVSDITVSRVLRRNEIQVIRRPNSKKRAVVTKEKEDLVIKLYKDGLIVRDISRIADLCTSTVTRIIKKNDVTSNRNAKVTDSMKTEICNLYYKGYSASEIAAKFKVSKSTVSRYIRIFNNTAEKTRPIHITNNDSEPMKPMKMINSVLLKVAVDKIFEEGVENFEQQYYCALNAVKFATGGNRRACLVIEPSTILSYNVSIVKACVDLEINACFLYPNGTYQNIFGKVDASKYVFGFASSNVYFYKDIAHLKDVFVLYIRNTDTVLEEHVYDDFDTAFDHYKNLIVNHSSSGASAVYLEKGNINKNVYTKSRTISKSVFD